MEKDIKDYLHLYLGCEVYCAHTDEQGVMYEINKQGCRVNGVFGGGHLAHGFVKPILRPLSDMSEEEAKIYFSLPTNVEIIKRHIVGGKYIEFEYRWVNENPKLNIEDGFCYSASAIGFDGTKVDNYADKIIYLIKQDFDLFGLIESGLAIDKTKTLTPTSQV